MDRFEPCENCTLADYIAVITFLLFPPAGLYLLILRRNEWRLLGIEWQEYLFIVIAVVVWIVIFLFSNKLTNGIFTADVALFFAISTSSFLGISLPASEYLARCIVATLSSIVSIELAISTALDWDKSLVRIPSSPEMHRLGLISLLLAVVIFVALPKVSRQPTLLAGLISIMKPITIDRIYSNYGYLLLSALALPFIFKSFPNFLLIFLSLIGFDVHL